MKKILGLDLGTNSIGWAVIKQHNNDHIEGIECAGSRIIPMDAATLGDFEQGNSKSQTADRTKFRGTRRLRERHLLRRERLHRVLTLLEALPSHYAEELNRYGKMISETKIAWKEESDKKRLFLFQSSYEEMLQDFKHNQPALVADNKKVPYDWTIYYLRKKALSEALTKHELAWILLHFNQKRGYYQLRGEEEEENLSKEVAFHALKVVAVEDSGDKKGKDTWYNVHLENGWIYRRPSSVELDWVGKTKEFIVTTDLEADGTPKKDKEGNIKRSFRAPKEDDWNLLKKKTEYDLEQADKSVGTYIYDTLLQQPNQKIRGSLVRTIERKYYKNELKSILEKQKEFHPELNDRALYKRSIEELYPHNEAHRNNIQNRDFTYLFLEDILFYQRPLKSKKSLISNCPYESHSYLDKETNQTKEAPIKCAARSHPLFQEFRLWQFIANLRIYEREKEVNGKLQLDVDVTSQFLPNREEYVKLFDWLSNRKEIKQDVLLNSYFNLKKPKGKGSLYPYRWNYVEGDKSYPCNETRGLVLDYLKKDGIDSSILTKEVEEHLWHILYSVEDKIEIQKALAKFAHKYQLPTSFAHTFSKFPPFKKEYAAYSLKAINKLLPLMRMGKYWCAEAIDATTQERIDKIICGEYDEKIKLRVHEKAIHLKDIIDFQSLPLWVACYIVYNRHSEAKEIAKWETPADIDSYLKQFKQHSLRNPIVEQVVTETLRTVRDIWKKVGQIDEIHLELGREMKNPADKRAKITQQVSANENANLRIKALLTEFLNPELEIENVRPYSPSQQEILRIYEEYALQSTERYDAKRGCFVSDPEMPEDVALILKKFNEIDSKKRPTKSEVIRYKLWLEQRYRSPYTGELIPLSKLFTPAYEIEHIIPQSRYFDDSLSNKVICESEVNKLKDNTLGYEFIKNNPGRKVELNHGKVVELFSLDAYERFINDNYARNRAKMKKLLMDEIPDGFIERQLNDSRYISKFIKGLLSNIVRQQGENGNYEEEAISKNLIVCTGGITDRLKREWGMNEVWNRIVMPRFTRLNELMGTTHFTALNREGHLIPAMPLELQKGFNKKRIDHRHHAMDAIVIACATRDHVNLLNNEAAKSSNKSNRYQLSRKLRRYEKVTINKNEDGTILPKEIEVAKEFLKPWSSFVADSYDALSNIIVSFKQNQRVINKTTNFYQLYQEGKKTTVRQHSGDSWAIRKPMHKDTVFGEINLRKIKAVSLNEAIKQAQSIVNKEFKLKLAELLTLEYNAKRIKEYFEQHKEVWQDINLSKIDIYYFTKDTKDRFFATRKALDSSFDKKKIETSIADSGIQKILLAHLTNHHNNPELAFSADGIDQMNRDIVSLNDGKNHQPIRKVRVYEKADKYAIGQTGNKGSKFVEAAKGTNLFFAVYESKAENKAGELIKKRSYATIPLNVAIERQKQGLPTAPADENGNNPIFVLSPNDLVYLPTEQESKEGVNWNCIDRSRIYKIVSFSGSRIFAIGNPIASAIIDKIEFTQQNKIELTKEKDRILPLIINRIGVIM
ncbi:MAG: type II CRISPR RNA-guided endonuclease Cas9 [Phocaeicola sp.]